MSDSLANLFSVDFAPLGHNYLWLKEILWLNTLADVLLVLSCLAIPFILLYFTLKRNDIEFKGVLQLFCLFFALLGLTQVVTLITVWHGAYGIQALIKAITAGVAVLAAIQLSRLLPKALNYPSASELKHGFEQVNLEREQRRHLEYSRKQDEIIRESTDAAHVGVLVISEQGHILVANKAACGIFGYHKDELEGQSISVLVDQKLATEHGSLVTHFFSKDVLRHKIAPQREVLGRTKRGDLIPLEIVLNMGKDSKHKVVYASVMDISERREIEIEKEEKARQLEIEKENFKSLFENLPDPCFVSDPESGQITKCNPAFEKMMAATGEQLLGLTKSDISPEYQTHVKKSSTDYYAEILSGIELGGSVQFEWVYNRLDGEAFIAAVSVSYVTIEGKDVFLSCWRDITEIKQKERELIDTRNKAIQAEKAKTDFLANMSHEIRTPMNAILGLTQLVSEMPLEEQAKEYVNKVQNSSHSLLNILNDILDYSKLEAGKLNIVEEPVDLHRVLEDVTGLFSLTAENKSLELILENTEEETTQVYADSMRLTQILNNLVGNGIKFTETGYVKVSLTIESAANNKMMAHFAVEDSGVGIAQHNIASLLSPFNQADSTINRRYGGTGLGLTISNHLLALMGSTLNISSELGRGSCFSFSLLLASCELCESYSLGSQRKQVGETFQNIETSSLHYQYPKARVLIVEDNDTNQLVALEFLKKLGIKASVVWNGAEAVKYVQDHADCLDLILMDLQMPEMDGFEASRRIKANQQSVHIPIIAMSAAVLKSDLEKVMAAGMNGHIAKPVALNELGNAIHRYLSHYAIEQPETAHEHTLPVYKSHSDDFDFESATKRFGGDGELLYKVAESAYLVHKDAPEKLQAMFANGDFTALKQYCHTIKSVLNSIGADGVAALAKQIEVNPTTPGTSEIKAFCLALSRCFEQLSLWLGDHKQKPAQPSLPTSQEDIATVLSEINKQLQDNRILSHADIDRLIGLLQDKVQKEQLQALKQALITFDYTAARAQIAGLDF